MGFAGELYSRDRMRVNLFTLSRSVARLLYNSSAGGSLLPRIKGQA